MDAAANVECPPLAGHQFRPVGVLPHKVPLPGPVPSALPSTVVVRHFYNLNFHVSLRWGCALTIRSTRHRFMAASHPCSCAAVRVNSGVRLLIFVFGKFGPPLLHRHSVVFSGVPAHQATAWLRSVYGNCQRLRLSVQISPPMKAPVGFQSFAVVKLLVSCHAATP